MELNSKLFAALKMEKIVMGLILSLIVMVASLNIVGTLILVVLTRGREISILRAMGASSQQILKVFMLEGVIIGTVGTAIGTLLGLIGCNLLDQYQFPLDTDVYYMDTLPVVIEPSTVLTVIISAIAISFFATIYPARVASKMDPVEGLRYE
jgi:lipoprotein-releasing system permease protein